MGKYNVEVNTSGHFAEVATSAIKDTAVLNEAAGVVVGNVTVLEAAVDTVKKYDASSEADCAGIVGIFDGTYANLATASYFTNGSEVTGYAGLTQGSEYYADPTTGLPGLWSAIGSGEWTRLLGVATSTTTLQLQFGEVRQKA